MVIAQYFLTKNYCKTAHDINFNNNKKTKLFLVSKGPYIVA